MFFNINDKIYIIASEKLTKLQFEIFKKVSTYTETLVNGQI